MRPQICLRNSFICSSTYILIKIFVQNFGRIQTFNPLLGMNQRSASVLLKDLENSIRNHPDARLKHIQEIGRALITDGLMPEAVKSDVSAVTERWSQLSQQVGIRPPTLFSHFLSLSLALNGTLT